jgi:hypothetical protein
MGEPDMIPIGLAAVFAAYSIGIWGYCLVRGYNVTFMQLFKGQWPGAAAAKTTTPAAAAPPVTAV